MNCIQCNRPFEDEDRMAAISGSILGDECTDVYYFCPVCERYTVVTWWDNFTTGDETKKVSGPEPRQHGDEQIELIRKCSRPWDKKCRCAVHMAYFRNTLD